MSRLRSFERKVVRKLATSALSIIEQETRAEILERMSDSMVTTNEFEGVSLQFYAPTPLLQWRANTVLSKEPDMVRWLDGLDRDAVLWDIGANIGVFSLYAARRTGCRALAFEPSAANFHALARNVVLNNLTDRISAYCVALAGRNGLGVLNLDSSAMGAALSQFGDVGDKSRYMGDQFTAQGMLGFTVDGFIDLFAPPFPTHIKIDVDGLELPIIGSASRTLRDPRVRSVMLELSLTDNEERSMGVKLMEASGLRYVSHGCPQTSGLNSAANHLFAR